MVLLCLILVAASTMQTFPFIQTVNKISGLKRFVKINDRFTDNFTTVFYNVLSFLKKDYCLAARLSAIRMLLRVARRKPHFDRVFTK